MIVGVGRVLSVGEATEYTYKKNSPPLRCMLWERNVDHSVRPGFADGFLFPYQEALALAEREEVDPEEFVAFTPDEHFDAYFYGSELLTHDGAVASLVACAATLHRIRGRIEGQWDQALAWIDTQLNRLWKARGAFPGLGSALSAFGYEWGVQHGSLLAYEIELLRERQGGGDPWALVDAVMEEPAKLGGPVAKLLRDGLRRGWKRLATDRRALLQLLGRCAISEDQALRMYDTTARAEAGRGQRRRAAAQSVPPLRRHRGQRRRAAAQSVPPLRARPARRRPHRLRRGGPRPVPRRGSAGAVPRAGAESHRRPGR